MYYVIHIVVLTKNFMQLRPCMMLLVIMFTFVFATCNKGRKSNESLSFSAFQYTVPVLIGKKDNPVIRLRIPGDDKSVRTLSAVSFSLAGTTAIKDIRMLRLYYTGASAGFSTRTLFATAAPGTGKITMKGSVALEPGDQYLWLSVELNSHASLLHKIDAVPAGVVLNNQVVTSFSDSAQTRQRIGIALRKAGDDNVKSYRIPGLTTTNAGTLIAVYDIRYNSSVDLQEDIDVGMSRSTDGGQTWEPMRKIMDMGTYGNKPQDQNGIGDPSVLVDKKTGDTWVAALWLHGYPKQRAWNASRPGLTPEKTGQLMLTKSTDDGQTWVTPVNITTQVKDPSWQLCFQGPGTGITMEDGTLVFPAQFKDSAKLPYSTIIYSKDHGTSWHIGTPAYPNTTEAQIVETQPGTLMLNMRDNRGGSRSVFTTTNLGKTWTEHPSSRGALVEPVCNASIIRHQYQGRTILFFVNPNTTKGRHHMTIKASLDGGLTWPVEKQLLLDELSGNGYPSLTVIDADHLGILYEGSQADLVFEKIPVTDILH